MVNEKLVEAIEARVRPQIIERILIHEDFDITHDDAPNGWFDIVCAKNGKVELVVRYQFWPNFGWYYDVIDGYHIKSVMK